MSARCGQIFVCVSLIITTHSSGGDVISRTMIFKEEEKEMKSLCSSLHHYFPHLLFLSTSKKGDMCMWTTGGGKKNCTVAFGKASSIQQTAPTHYQVSTIPSSSSLSLSLPLEIDWKKEPTTTISVIFYMGRSVMMGVGNEDTCLLRSCVLCIPCSVMEHVGYLSKIYIGPSFSPDEFG